MTREEIISGLQMTMDLFLFDPTTGKTTVPDMLNDLDRTTYDACKGAIEALKAQETHDKRTETHACDCVSRQAAIDAIKTDPFYSNDQVRLLQRLPSAQPERKWTPCSNPPKHHKDVIVRGIEAIGNVTVHKVMQWDVDTWRPTDYAPSVTWKEWSEI